MSSDPTEVPTSISSRQPEVIVWGCLTKIFWLFLVSIGALIFGSGLVLGVIISSL